MITISADDLINMNDKADIYNFHVDLTYAKEDNLLFGERIYDENAQLWLHRELAVDIGVVTPDGQVIDMGCPFDYLANNPNVEHNPAHRDYPHTPEVTANRKILDDCMINAAQELGTPLNLLTEEWWDFRLPREYYNQFAPISKTILPKNTP